MSAHRTHRRKKKEPERDKNTERLYTVQTHLIEVDVTSSDLHIGATAIDLLHFGRDKWLLDAVFHSREKKEKQTTKINDNHWECETWEKCETTAEKNRAQCKIHDFELVGRVAIWFNFYGDSATKSNPIEIWKRFTSRHTAKTFSQSVRDSY